MQRSFKGFKNGIIRIFAQESERKLRPHSPSFRFLAAVIGICASLALGRAAAGDSTEAHPFIPGFWNPDAVPAKPDLGGLGAIRFITIDDYPPFGFALANGGVAGFNIDLARALCDELQLTCTIQARPWNGVLPALESGQGDAAIASIAISNEARGTVAFTSPYYRTPARFVTRLPSMLPVVDPEGLAGKRVGVLKGTSHEAFLRLFFPQAAAVPFSTIEEARAALKGGGVEAVFGDAITWSIWLNGTDAAGCCAFAGGPYTESRFFGPGAGIAVRKGDSVLRQALNYALARVAAKGLYGDIYLRYFPLGFY